MRRVRRISVSIEHREISASITQILQRPVTSSGSTGSPDVLKDAIPPVHCPQCGGTWFMGFQDVLDRGFIDWVLLKLAILTGSIHLQRQPDGQLWICERSLQQFKEKPG
ncbi:hypothetical protein [Terracidiphilus gabretensis]|uniref:hypothetical protein n=1 Tax=Terracidiphilus gabretensis TaxID=1577687 RepID=UPI0018D2149B|nr:hypothetical protein [Terracidiphilus gabretensis]